MPLFETRDLALYAAVVATANGAWALYSGVVRDRPRIVIRAARAEAVPTVTGRRYPVFHVSVSNRGRRAVSVGIIARMTSTIRGTSIVTVDFLQQTHSKPRLEESQSRTFVHGQQGGYRHGDLPMRRWYVVDGAGRIHPLRKRYRQRIEAFVFWPIRCVLDLRDKRRREDEREREREQAHRFVDV